MKRRSLFNDLNDYMSLSEAYMPVEIPSMRVEKLNKCMYGVQTVGKLEGYGIALRGRQTYRNDFSIVFRSK